MAKDSNIWDLGTPPFVIVRDPKGGFRVKGIYRRSRYPVNENKNPYQAFDIHDPRSGRGVFDSLKDPALISLMSNPKEAFLTGANTESDREGMINGFKRYAQGKGANIDAVKPGSPTAFLESGLIEPGHRDGAKSIKSMWGGALKDFVGFPEDGVKKFNDLTKNIGKDEASKTRFMSTFGYDPDDEAEVVADITGQEPPEGETPEGGGESTSESLEGLLGNRAEQNDKQAKILDAMGVANIETIQMVDSIETANILAEYGDKVAEADFDFDLAEIKTIDQINRLTESFEKDKQKFKDRLAHRLEVIGARLENKEADLAETLRVESNNLRHQAGSAAIEGRRQVGQAQDATNQRLAELGLGDSSIAQTANRYNQLLGEDLNRAVTGGLNRGLDQAEDAFDHRLSQAQKEALIQESEATFTHDEAQNEAFFRYNQGITQQQQELGYATKEYNFDKDQATVNLARDLQTQADTTKINIAKTERDTRFEIEQGYQQQEDYINDLVAEGKLTPEQGEQRKQQLNKNREFYTGGFDPTDKESYKLPTQTPTESRQSILDRTAGGILPTPTPSSGRKPGDTVAVSVGQPKSNVQTGGRAKPAGNEYIKPRGQ